MAKFYVPPTLQTDFDDFLKTDIPGSVMDFELITDWYAQFEEGYQKTIIRGQIYPDSTKSRYQDTDNNLNFRGGLHSGIKKGDMIKDPDGTLYLFDWAVAPQSNNRATRAVRCNLIANIQKYQNETTDEDGYLINDAGYITIVDNLPCNAVRYDGRPEYSAVYASPGISPNALSIMYVQYNEKTKNIQIDNIVEWGKDVFIIIDMDYVGVDIQKNYGVIRLQMRKATGKIGGLYS